MIFPRVPRRLGRPVRDFLLGLALFVATAASGVIETMPSGTGWFASAAHARLFELAPSDVVLEAMLSGPVSWGGPQMLALASMAAAFASVFTLNMWLARHLRQAHASYRRRR